jgi:AraC-like DNA-binding protein
MLLTGLLFASHFLYFAHLNDVYIFFEVPSQIIGLSIFPLYHIYFRLLTVDEHFTIKKHARYLIFPVSVVLMYGIVVLLTPLQDYKSWLFNLTIDNRSAASFRLLGGFRMAVRITFVIVLVRALAGNYLLLRKYGHLAEQFYSDIVDAKQKNARNINHIILASGIISFVITTIGRSLLMPSDWIIYIGWTLFSILLFLIGDSGIRQKVINPSVDPDNREDVPATTAKISIKDEEIFWNKIRAEFTQNKIYLNSELNILDLVSKVGSNRTYISFIINKQCNQNFCSFVNGFRLEEMKRIYLENQGLNQEDLASRSGFGSVNSMKRTISARLGISFSEFKNQIYEESLKKRPPDYSSDEPL